MTDMHARVLWIGQCLSPYSFNYKKVLLKNEGQRKQKLIEFRDSFSDRLYPLSISIKIIFRITSKYLRGKNNTPTIEYLNIGVVYGFECVPVIHIFLHLI